jgi:putative endonuclease
MYYVYILLSLKDQRTYIGYTNDLGRRITEHNTGKSKSTKNRTPFVLLFTEEFLDNRTAKNRETWWKSAAGRRRLKNYFDTNSIDTK